MKPVMQNKAMKRVLPVIRRADTDEREQLKKENEYLKNLLRGAYYKGKWDKEICKSVLWKTIENVLSEEE